MATKTISITEEAYNRLSHLKKENESFSLVIQRITGKHKLMEIFGVLSGKAGNEFEKSIIEGRKRDTSNKAKRIKSILEELNS